MFYFVLLILLKGKIHSSFIYLMKLQYKKDIST